MPTIGETIRKERKALGVSQRELARRIWGNESRRRTVIAWEQGDNEPEPENLDRIALALGIPRRRLPDRETRETLATRRTERLIRDEIERQLLPLKRDIASLKGQLTRLRKSQTEEYHRAVQELRQELRRAS